MTPLERLKAGLERSQGAGCEVDNTVKQSQHDYEKQADEADRRLQDKHAQELQKFLK